MPKHRFKISTNVNVRGNGIFEGHAWTPLYIPAVCACSLSLAPINLRLEVQSTHGVNGTSPLLRRRALDPTGTESRYYDIHHIFRRRNLLRSLGGAVNSNDTHAGRCNEPVPGRLVLRYNFLVQSCGIMAISYVPKIRCKGGVCRTSATQRIFAQTCRSQL
jgi:hypothetical protein